MTAGTADSSVVFRVLPDLNLHAGLTANTAADGKEIIEIMKAKWNGTILAESDETIVVEGNHYFPKNSVNSQFFKPSETHTVCSWKGTCSYYDVVVDGQTNKDAAWYYPDTKTDAKNIEGYVAFWKGVEVGE